jgi:hypothetical protein
MRATKENGILDNSYRTGTRSLRFQDLRFEGTINRRFDSIWTGKTKLSGYSVIVLAISTETDNSPSSRLAEIVNSLCGGLERKQSKQGIESCPVEAIV